MSDGRLTIRVVPEPVDAKAHAGLQAAFAKRMEELAWTAMLGGRPHKPRATALRVASGGRSFETVELDDAGNVAEPPPRCHCTVLHRADCPNAFRSCGCLRTERLLSRLGNR